MADSLLLIMMCFSVKIVLDKSFAILGRNSFLGHNTAHGANCARSSSQGSLLRFTPKGQSSDIRLLLLSKRKHCFRLEKEEGNKRVEFPHQGETEQSVFSSDALRGAECILFNAKPNEVGSR